MKKAPVAIEYAKERRLVGYHVTVGGGGFARPVTASFHAMYERVVAIKRADGVTYVTTQLERGRSVQLTGSDVALAVILKQAEAALDRLVPDGEDKELAYNDKPKKTRANTSKRKKK